MQGSRVCVQEEDPSVNERGRCVSVRGGGVRGDGRCERVRRRLSERGGEGE